MKDRDSSAKAKGAKAKILLIDDEPVVRDELGGILEDEGYEVITGADGEEGLLLFRGEHPDMIITDVRMPRRDGLMLTETIRMEDPMIPITVITGHGNEAMVIKALQARVTDFIQKPVRLDDLLAALARMEAARLPTLQHSTEMPTSVVIIEQTWTHKLNNDLSVIPIFVDRLINLCTSGLLLSSTSELRLALRELVINAIEHGNLGLSYQEKTEALENNTFGQLISQRGRLPQIRKRRVTVTTRRQAKSLIFQIEDEGKGFDWRSLPDPLDPSYVLSVHGRGILLAKLSLDSLSFNEAGNQVTAVKHL